MSRNCGIESKHLVQRALRSPAVAMDTVESSSTASPSATRRRDCRRLEPSAVPIRRSAPFSGLVAVVTVQAALELEPATWLPAFGALLLLASGVLFYLARLKRLRARIALLERRLEERATELESARRRYADLAREDALTGLAQRRAFDEALEFEWRRAHRLDTSLALLLIDADRLRPLNERLGRSAGDACLRAIAGATTGVCRRAGELVARYGAEELAAILPGASLADAVETGEKIRRAVELLAIAHPASDAAQVATVSVGVAALRPRVADSPLALLAAADRALYRAKQTGRNRVESNEDSP